MNLDEKQVGGEGVYYIKTEVGLNYLKVSRGFPATM
jgi:hypothetical protein